MIICTRLLHEFLKVREDHTSIVQSPHGLGTRAVRGVVQQPWDFYERLQRQHNDRTISIRSLHVLSTTLHRSDVEIRQRNCTMAVLM